MVALNATERNVSHPYTYYPRHFHRSGHITSCQRLVIRLDSVRECSDDSVCASQISDHMMRKDDAELLACPGAWVTARTWPHPISDEQLHARVLIVPFWVAHERDRRRKGVILAVFGAASQEDRTELLGKLRIEAQRFKAGETSDDEMVLSHLLVLSVPHEVCCNTFASKAISFVSRSWS
jgi:hypothetical protein